MKTTAVYSVWLDEVEQALASINMPMEEWQERWTFDFQREYQSGADANDAAMKSNRFWWREQNKAIHQDCTLSEDCWLPRGHHDACQPVTKKNPGSRP
jgi:hypothetical protein